MRETQIFSRGISLTLALVMLLSFAPIFGLHVFAESMTGDDGTTNWDFIEPVTHQKTIPSGYIGIYTAQDLDNIRNNLSGNYIIMNDIDLSVWGNWYPIGVADSSFTGELDGNGYIVKNMRIIQNSNDVSY